MRALEGPSRVPSTLRVAPMDRAVALEPTLRVKRPATGDHLAPPKVGNTGDLSARITGLSSPLMNRIGLIEFPWEKPGDALPVELQVAVSGDPSQVRAELWTNANNNASPDQYQSIPMKLVRTEGSVATFRVDVPITAIGNYRASARVSTDGGKSFRWASDSGVPDLRFRPRDEAHDALNITEVSIGNVNADPVTRRLGTFADMMESGSPDTNGKYTLEWLAKQGKNAIWLMPPFEISKWEGRHPLDDAGSPYAVKDYFSIRTELARSAQGLTGEAAREAALAEFKAFVDKAHSLGIKVILDVALNHVGHNLEFRDLFIGHDASGREIREVRKNDFSNVITQPGQLEQIRRGIDDPEIPDYAEWVAPWLYGSASGDPRGARSAHDKVGGGWGEWLDTAQLNHGRRREGYHWWDEANPSAEQRAVQGWMTRILQFWAVDMNVDGFRLDHLTGLPLSVLETSLNLVEADVDQHHPGKNLFVTGEDFHTQDDTRPWLDAGQGGWFHEFVKAHSPADFENVVESPYFHDLLNLSSHDEHRPVTHFGHDLRALTRTAALLQVLGGPVVEVAGDEVGERDQLAFKQSKAIPWAKNLAEGGAQVASYLRKVGTVRAETPALLDDNRAWLRPRIGGADPDLLAVARHPDAKEGRVVFATANLNNVDARENAFNLDAESASRIDPAGRYQLRDLLADDPHRHVWSAPLTGQELLDRGLFVRMKPYELQVLELTPVD